MGTILIRPSLRAISGFGALLALGLASLLNGQAVAGTGVTRVAASSTDGPVTVFYPSLADDVPLQRGPFVLRLAAEAPPVRGNSRLVVISHGSGASPWVQTDLAQAFAEAGFVVALPTHRGDNASDPSTPGPDSWDRRPAEVSRAIDAVGRDPRFAGLVDLSRVGVYGMSAGGHTALSLAGGRWSPANFVHHCEADLAADFPACVGLATRLIGGPFDGLKKAVALMVLRYRFNDGRLRDDHDPRVAAVVAGVPAAADFEMSSLAAPRVPLGLVTAPGDKWLVPRFHSDRVLQACQPCELVAEIPGGGHGALLSPLPPASAYSATEAELLNDPPGFDRSVMPEVHRRIVAFFSRHLLP